jgi:hypothetical protein
MKPARLRAWIQRFGTPGLLLVGAYLLGHHLWHKKRRLCFLAGGGLILTLSVLFWWCGAASRPTAVTSTRPAPVRPEDVPDHQPPPADIGIEAPLGINGDLFFSGQFYRMSGEFYTYEFSKEKEETLTEDGSNRFYRVGPDGSRQQIRFQEEDKLRCVSPDGRRIAFVRADTEVWIKPVSGGQATHLRQVKDTILSGLQWSPEGRWLAFLTCKDKTDYEPECDLTLIDVERRQSLRYEKIEEFAWSPEGRLYILFGDHSAQIISPQTGAVQQVRDVIQDALWLDNHRLLGNVPSEKMYQRLIRCIGEGGREQWQQTLTGPMIDDYEDLSYHRIPGERNRVLVRGRHDMTDGLHFACGIVDLPTGRCQLIQRGTLIGIAPDGSQIAVADHNWVGPYKRGGQRVGPLTLVSLKSGRTRKLTGPLAEIFWGEWRPAPKEPRLSRDRQLLRVLERGDARQAQSLLEQEASPNAAFPNGPSALMIAAGEGMEGTVDLLLNKGANVNATSMDGETALMAVCGYGLSSSPPDHNEYGPGYAPREMLSESQQRLIVKSMLAAGAKVNARDKKGVTALMLAAATGRTSIVALLLKRGRINARDQNGYTSLMCAAKHRRMETSRFLLRHGANPRLRTKSTLYDDGDTAASLVNFNHKALAALLETAEKKWRP